MAVTIEKIWQILEEGETLTKYTNQSEATLVLGLRGSGKTTTTLLLTNNVKKLTSVRSMIDPTQLIILNREKHPRIPFPLQMIDNSTVYYDCPSFGEGNRNLKDLTSADSMRKLIDRLNGIKFLFVLEYSFVNRVDRREHFLDWIKQITRLVKNVGNFQRNIGLVVTRVANPKTLKSDLEIIREIKHFLETVRKLIERDEYDWIFKTNAEKLIDSFLSDEKDCNRVTILRSPKEPGSILKMEHLNDELTAIKSMMKSCVASTLNRDDFGYTISGRTEKYVKILVDRIHVTTKTALSNLAMEIRKHFDERETNYRDTHQLKDEFLVGTKQLNLTVSKMDETMTFQNVGLQLERSFEAMKFVTAGDDMQIFFLQDEYLRFLERVGLRKFPIEPSKFKTPLEELVVYLAKVGQLYDAIIKTYESFWKPEVQVEHRNRCKKYSIAECLKDFGDYEIIGSLEETEARKAAITEMLNAIEAPPTRGESNLTGNVLQTRDINLNNKEGINSIKIFASKKVFVNTDLLLAIPRLDVTIISPVWEIIDNHKIFFRWYGFEPQFKTGFLGVGRNFINGRNLMMDGKSKGLTNDAREMRNVNLIALNGSVIGYGNVKPTQGSKTCTLSFQTNYGVHFDPAPEYGSYDKPWSPAEYKANTVNEYKRYLISDFKDRIGYRGTSEMFQMLDKDPCIRNFYKGRGFVNELLQLELAFDPKRKNDFLPLYESLKDRAVSYAETIRKKTSQIERHVVWHVYRTASSKIWSLKHDATKELITDVESRMKEIFEMLDDMEKHEIPEKVEGAAAAFQKKIQKDIDGILEHINKNILPEIDIAMKRVDKTTDLLLTDIQGMTDKLKEHREDMKKAKKAAKLASILKILMGVVKGIGVLVSFMTGPAAPMVSAGILAGATIVEQFIPEAQAATYTTAVPQGAQNIVKLKQEWTEDLEKRNKLGLQRALQVITIGVKSSNVAWNELYEVRNKIEEGLKESKVEIGPLRDMMNQKKTSLMKWEKKGLGRLLGTALTACASPTYPINESEIKEQLTETDKYTESIAADTEKIEQLAMLQDHINNMLKPALAKTGKHLKEVTSNINKESRVEFNYQQYDIKKTIRNMQERMRGVIAGFPAEKEIQNAWDQLKDVMDQLMNVYDQIHDSRDKFELVDTLAQMKIMKKNGTNLIQDPEMKKDLKRLDVVYFENVVVGKYVRLLDAVKLIKFPFANSFLGGSNAVISTNPNEGKFHTIRRLTKTLRDTIVKHDANLRKGYDDEIVELSSKRFFVWRNEDYREKITRFLKGEEIVLVADITKGVSLNAVKFNSIKFVVKAENKETQKEIEQILAKFKIVLKHSGVSRYKCGRKIYVLTSMETQLEFSFATKENKFVTISDTTAKLAAADSILSPYTTWKMKLASELGTQAKFGDLKKFENYVDLELRGSGSYVKENSTVCNENLREHYEMDPTLFPSRSSVAKPTAIGGIFNWVTSLPRRLFAPKQELRYDEFAYEDYGLEKYPTSFDGNLMLLDLLARKCTGSKLNSIRARSGNETRIQDALIRSVGMTMELEKALRELLKKYYPGEEGILFDPCVLVDQLKSSQLNGKGRRMKKIMEEFVIKNNSLLTKGGFLNDLRVKVKGIVGSSRIFPKSVG